MCETTANLGPLTGLISLVSLTLASSHDVPLDDIDRLRRCRVAGDMACLVDA